MKYPAPTLRVWRGLPVSLAVATLGTPQGCLQLNAVMVLHNVSGSKEPLSPRGTQAATPLPGAVRFFVHENYLDYLESADNSIPQAPIFLRQAYYRYFEVSLYVRYGWAGQRPFVYFHAINEVVNTLFAIHEAAYCVRLLPLAQERPDTNLRYSAGLASELKVKRLKEKGQRRKENSFSLLF